MMIRVNVFTSGHKNVMAELIVRTKVMSWLATVTTVEKVSSICALRMELKSASTIEKQQFVMEKKTVVMEVTKALNSVGSAKNLLPTAHVS